MLILLLFRAGNIEAAINSPTGQPYIGIILNATGSVAGTAVMGLVYHSCTNLLRDQFGHHIVSTTLIVCQRRRFTLRQNTSINLWSR